MKRESSILVQILGIICLCSCIGQAPAGPVVSAVPEVSTEALEAPRIRNVILIIGDGMGPQQVGLLSEYARRAPRSVYGGEPTMIERFAEEGVLGLASHGPHDALVVDSACSATQLATGQASLLEAVGVDTDGNPVQTILQIARDLGKSTGLISDTRITHATPAAFATHAAHRSMENELAIQMLESEVDLLLSGGLRHFLPQSVNRDEEVRAAFAERIGQAFSISSSRTDDRDLLTEAQEKNYTLAFDRASLAAADGGRILGLFANSAMLDAVEERQTRDAPDRREPSLAELAEVALERLDEREEGFFLMIEAGLIDWAGHDNDAGTLLHEMLRLDEVLGSVYRWAQGRQDTLILITADHETGGFGFSYSGQQIPEPQNLSGSVFDEHSYAPEYNFGSLDVLDGLYEQSMSFARIFAVFDAAQDPSPEALMALVNEHSAFPISLDQAEAILRTEPNRHRVPGHPYLEAEMFPFVQDFSPYYVYGDEVRRNLLGRALAPAQNVVWATGTHTHTPVPVIAWGPRPLIERFDRFQHLTDVGRIAIEAMGPQE
jgi:alkaline phosphatase